MAADITDAVKRLSRINTDLGSSFIGVWPYGDASNANRDWERAMFLGMYGDTFGLTGGGPAAITETTAPPPVARPMTHPAQKIWHFPWG